MIKTLSIEIIKPINIEWKQFGNILYNLQKETREIMNKTIQLCWEYDGFSSDYKLEHNLYSKEKEILKDGLSLGGYIYDRLKDDKILYSANNSQSQQRAIKKWKDDKKTIFTGERSIPNFKRDNPLDLHNKSIKIIKDDINSNFQCDLKLLNRQGVKDNFLESSNIQVLLSVKDNSTKQILSRIISGEYKIGGSQIKKHKTKPKWILNLNFQFEVKDKILNSENILGVDMGIVYPVYMVVNKSLQRDKIEGGEIEKFRKGVVSRRNSMLNQGKYCGDGRIGHGIKTRIKPTEVLGDKISNFRSTCNHKYSRRVVDFAVKNNCGTIQMEDLSGINKDNIFLKNWSYFDLQQKIKYKALENGIEVKMISPKYTSQRCSSCGFIHKDNREDQKTFKCKKCEFETNADYNAAKNISTLGIEEIIVQGLKLQEDECKNSIKYLYNHT